MTEFDGKVNLSEEELYRALKAEEATWHWASIRSDLGRISEKEFLNPKYARGIENIVKYKKSNILSKYSYMIKIVNDTTLKNIAELYDHSKSGKTLGFWYDIVSQELQGYKSRNSGKDVDFIQYLRLKYSEDLSKFYKKEVEEQKNTTISEDSTRLDGNNKKKSSSIFAIFRNRQGKETVKALTSKGEDSTDDTALFPTPEEELLGANIDSGRDIGNEIIDEYVSQTVETERFLDDVESRLRALDNLPGQQRAANVASDQAKKLFEQFKKEGPNFNFGFKHNPDETRPGPSQGNSSGKHL